jgi:hypothetical protein
MLTREIRATVLVWHGMKQRRPPDFRSHDTEKENKVSTAGHGRRTMSATSGREKLIALTVGMRFAAVHTRPDNAPNLFA